MIGLTALTTVALLAVNSTDDADGTSSVLFDWLRAAVGVLMIALSVNKWRGRAACRRRPSPMARLYVATGCNRGFGEVAVNDDGTVNVGVIALTKMACETPVNDWEQALSVFLSGTLSYAVSGTDVTLTNGTQTLTMHEVPWTP